MWTCTKSFLCALIVAWLGLNSIADAASIPGLFNTGVNGAGVPLPNLSTSIDSHYVITVNPDVGLGADGTTHVHFDNAFPIGAWLGSTATSKWIAPRFDTSPSAGGDYRYTLTFDLSGLQPATANITGQWAVDNATADSALYGVFLNGVKVEPGNTGGFGSFTNFSIGPGDPFLPGLNTLAFSFNNAGAGFTALHVNNLVGTALAVPEPSTIVVWSIVGMASVCFVFRRRQCR